ncbi:MAG: hypothetical protein J7K48_03905 [Thermococcus sp.]|nr:hypothetical protein [Thermococcus sp.]
MTFFGNVHHDWKKLQELAEAAGDWELYEFARRMEENEKRWEPRAPWEK